MPIFTPSFLICLVELNITDQTRAQLAELFVRTEDLVRVLFWNMKVYIPAANFSWAMAALSTGPRRAGTEIRTSRF